MRFAAGTKLGPYEVIGPLGTGGMGEVYRARDTRLSRDVAVKVLPAAFASDPERLRRFQQEAHAIAALNHPHICQLYDVGPNYLVMEYIEGQPLHCPLPIDDALRLAIQIASALEEAHSKGIIHRDLKPGNIMVSTKSGAKLLDFGLASFTNTDVDVTRTADGMMVGTCGYMSPEQVADTSIDERSDIFSFGAVLYEMLSGTRAFRGDTTAQVVGEILHRDPPPLPLPTLEPLLRRCVSKQLAQRFQTMTEVRVALERAARCGAAGATEQTPSIAVLPFANRSADPEDEYFSDGLADEITNALMQVPQLKVIARTSAFAFKGKQDDVRRIADALGVENVLEGSVRRAGNRVRVTAQLITARDGTQLWSERYDRELADIFAIQDDIAQAIATALRVTLSAWRGNIQQYVPKLAAYEALLKGRHHALRHYGRDAKFKVYFEQAMELDPGYAEPHASLGLAYFLSVMTGGRSLREMMPLIRAEAQQALHLDPSNPAPHFLLGSASASYEYDWKKAAEHFAIAMAHRSSLSSEMHWAYASLYLQPLGRFREAASEMGRAVELDPLNALWRGVFASHLTHAQLYDRAIDQAKQALDIDATSFAPLLTLGEAYASSGRWAEAREALENAHRVVPYDSLVSGLLAGVLARLGQKARAEELIGQMGEAPRPIFGRVLYHILCGDIDASADWFERAIEDRDPFALVFVTTPLTSDLRQSPRWLRLTRMMNLPEQGAI
jgi:TolB-like protein/cytochrome c-type biogenesis protein CcmH/NrfG/predicted Ser/Thr protein kinase